MLQENWQENPLPWQNRAALSTMNLIKKTLELFKIVGPMKKRQDAIVRVGKGEKNRTFKFNLSGPIDLSKLKSKSKEMGVTINDLFAGAVIAAYTKLDLPEERKPSQYLCYLAASTASSKIIDDQFQPENEATVVSPVFERNTDLTQASLNVREVMAPFKGRHDLFEAQWRLLYFLKRVFSNQ